MRKQFFVITLLMLVQSSFAQSFTNKTWRKADYYQYGSWLETFRLDYVSNERNKDGSGKATLYLTFLSDPNCFTFCTIENWYDIKIRDNATGKIYKITNGNKITLRNDAVFGFYNTGEEIPFSLTFEALPADVKNIDVIWTLNGKDYNWFTNVDLNPQRDDSESEPYFYFNYFLFTVTFYSSLPSNIYFVLDGHDQSDLVLDQTYYDNNRAPSSCGSSGTLTIGFPRTEKDHRLDIEAYSTSNDGKKRKWKFTETPSIDCFFIKMQ